MASPVVSLTCTFCFHGSNKNFQYASLINFMLQHKLPLCVVLNHTYLIFFEHWLLMKNINNGYGKELLPLIKENCISTQASKQCFITTKQRFCFFIACCTYSIYYSNYFVFIKKIIKD